MAGSHRTPLPTMPKSDEKKKKSTLLDQIEQDQASRKEYIISNEDREMSSICHILRLLSITLGGKGT